MKKAVLFLITLLIALLSNAQFSNIAQPDSVWVNFGETISFNPTLNDVDTTGNPIIIDTVYSNDLQIISYNDSIITFKMLDYGLYRFQIGYRVLDTTSMFNFGTQIYVFPEFHIDTIDANDIKAVIYPGSMQFWDYYFHYAEINNYDLGPQFFYPSNSLAGTFWNYNLWLGGVNEYNNNIHLAAERYRQNGTDFWPGPLTNNGLALADSVNAGKWTRTWKVTSEEILYHLNHYNDPNYKMPEAIQSWPAHGDQNIGQARFLAPFVDVDLDQEYHPEKGDYPLIKGDQSIFFIFNDRLGHTETEGEQIGVEIHCMVWAKKIQRENEVLNSTIFYSYKLFNRSMRTFNDFYIGAWSDFDLGYAWDDYMGCNVEEGYYYVYNGRDEDGGGEPYSYGKNPPSQATCILGGPFMDGDLMDNPDGGCNESINGVGFGDGVVDNERLGLSYFVYHNNGGFYAMSDPQYAPEYYQMLSGKWKDDSPMVYGGNAHYLAGGDINFPTRYMWPGDSDPCNWGTNGLEPSWDTIWNEETSGNQYGDRRGLGSVGPFTFEAGSVEYLDIALVTAPGDQEKNSKDLLEEYVKAIRAEYIKNPEEFGNQYLNTDDIANEPNESISIFPNPSKGDHIYLNLPNEKETVYNIYNSTSQLVQQGFLLAQKQQEIDISDLPSGWFILEVIQNGKAYRTKLIR